MVVHADVALFFQGGIFLGGVTQQVPIHVVVVFSQPDRPATDAGRGPRTSSTAHSYRDGRPFSSWKASSNTSRRLTWGSAKTSLAFITGPAATPASCSSDITSDGSSDWVHRLIFFVDLVVTLVPLSRVAELAFAAPLGVSHGLAQPAPVIIVIDGDAHPSLVTPAGVAALDGKKDAGCPGSIDCAHSWCSP